jgi:hypothetical protein
LVQVLEGKILSLIPPSLVCHDNPVPKKAELSDLDEIRKRLLGVDQNDARMAIWIAERIPGLGTAGASGLLALMYPQHFGTVDQFAIKALREIRDLPETPALAKMNPDSLTAQDGVSLIGIYRRKADELNSMFQSASWTPRKIDKVLWTYGRDSDAYESSRGIQASWLVAVWWRL